MLTANYAGWLNALDMTCFCCCKVTVDVNSQMLSIIGHGGSSKGLKSLIWIRSHGLYIAVYENWNNKMQLKTVGERVHHSSPSTCVSAVFWDTIVFVYFSWQFLFHFLSRQSFIFIFARGWRVFLRRVMETSRPRFSPAPDPAGLRGKHHHDMMMLEWTWRILIIYRWRGRWIGNEAARKLPPCLIKAPLE